jgi:hypothetical protein
MNDYITVNCVHLIATKQKMTETQLRFLLELFKCNILSRLSLQQGSHEIARRMCIPVLFAHFASAVEDFVQFIKLSNIVEFVAFIRCKCRKSEKRDYLLWLPKLLTWKSI